MRVPSAQLTGCCGDSGRSNALTIARRLGLKPEVVDAAKSHVGAATDDINQVIAGLEAQRRSETKATEAQELLQQVQRLYQEVSEKQQHCRNANRHCGSNKLGRCRARSLKPKEIAQVIRQLHNLRQRQLPSKQRMP